MARSSADAPMIDTRHIKYLKRLVRRVIAFLILSVVVVYVTLEANGDIRDIELYLGFVIAFTTVLLGLSLTVELIGWLLSWLASSPD